MAYFTAQDIINAYADVGIDLTLSRYLDEELAYANAIAADRGIEYAQHCVRCWAQSQAIESNADAAN